MFRISAFSTLLLASSELGVRREGVEHPLDVVLSALIDFQKTLGLFGLID